MTFDELLHGFVKRGASDIHLHVGLQPMIRLNGKLVPVSENNLTP